MSYAKPEVVASNFAFEVIAAVQLDKTVQLSPDRNGPNFIESAGAYEADE